MNQENRELMTRRTELSNPVEGLIPPTPIHRTLWIIALAVCFAAGCGASHPIKYYQLTVPANGAPLRASSSAVVPPKQ